MADYLKTFATQADYEAYIAGSYDKPNVSYIEATDETIFTNYEDGPAGPDTVITGLKIADFTGTTFQDSRRYITEAVIPDGVASIFEGAFHYCYSLTSIDIPSGVTSIGNSAFDNCRALTSIDIPSGVTSIGNSAFQDCQTLTSIDIPSGVTKINDQVFYGCTSLASIDIPSGVTSIGQNAFLNCQALTSIDIPSGATSIGHNAFRNCSSLASVTVRATTPPTLGSSVFFSTHPNMVIYVPASAVEDYKAASGWSTYASQIQAIP